MIDTSPAPATLPSGLRVYAIGDVHGCLTQLLDLHDAIAEDLAARPIEAAILIHLGDYIDRGPDSAGVVRLLAEGHRPPGIRTVVNLMGNHEDMMLAVLQDVRHAPLWLANGGANSLASWGIAPTSPPAQWAAALPDADCIFLRYLAPFHRVGGYIFVHAGLRPGVSLARQDLRDLLWIREPFLSSPAPFEGVVVHGHTPRPEPEVRANRIGIDTGAVLGGRLTCLMLEAGRLGFLSA